MIIISSSKPQMVRKWSRERTPCGCTHRMYCLQAATASGSTTTSIIMYITSVEFQIMTPIKHVIGSLRDQTNVLYIYIYTQICIYIYIYIYIYNYYYYY